MYYYWYFNTLKLLYRVKVAVAEVVALCIDWSSTTFATAASTTLLVYRVELQSIQSATTSASATSTLLVYRVELAAIAEVVVVMKELQSIQSSSLTTATLSLYIDIDSYFYIDSK